MTSTCSNFCADPAPCVLDWFKSPCVCTVAAGGVAPTVAITRPAEAEAPPAQAEPV